MTRKTVRIAMNGVTGRMGYHQHLVRSILALREQGGLGLGDGTVLWPEPVPVGRRDHALKLAIEPLRPMSAADRCVVSALAQALDLAERFPAHQVGVTVDTYHLWWDDRAPGQIARAGAGGRIHAFQLADWTTPLPAGVLDGRGQIGDGAIDLREWKGYVEAAGYTGPIEVELFNDELWARDGREVLAETARRFVTQVMR